MTKFEKYRIEYRYLRWLYKWLFEYYMVIWIPTFILTALPKWWQLGPIVALQRNNIFSLLLKWHHKSREIIKNNCVCRNNINVTCQLKRNIIYEYLKDGIRPDSEKRDIEETQKVFFADISKYETFLWNGNYFAVILCSFSKIMEILVKNIIKTADGISNSF